MLECLDAWLGLQDKRGEHPDSFKAHVDKITVYLQHCCYRPSLLMLYKELAGR